MFGLYRRSERPDVIRTLLSRGDSALEYGGSSSDDDGAIVFESSAVYHLTVTC